MSIGNECNILDVYIHTFIEFTTEGIKHTRNCEIELSLYIDIYLSFSKLGHVSVCVFPKMWGKITTGSVGVLDGISTPLGLIDLDVQWI